MTDLGNQSFKKIILPSEKLAKAVECHPDIFLSDSLKVSLFSVCGFSVLSDY